MANRNTLHKTKIEAFKSFLDQEGIAHRPGKGTWQELQVSVPNRGWYCVYSRADMPEHYTIQDPLNPLVKQFLHNTKIQSDAQSVADLSGVYTLEWLDSETVRLTKRAAD